MNTMPNVYFATLYDWVVNYELVMNTTARAVLPTFPHTTAADK